MDILSHIHAFAVENKMSKNTFTLLLFRDFEIQNDVIINRYFDNIYSIKYKLNGKMHRLNGPAVIYSNEHTYWYSNDKLHRLNGPAIVSNHMEWYVHDKLHKLNGPAITHNGTACKCADEYYIRDIVYSKGDWENVRLQYKNKK